MSMVKIGHVKNLKEKKMRYGLYDIKFDVILSHEFFYPSNKRKHDHEMRMMRRFYTSYLSQEPETRNVHYKHIHMDTSQKYYVIHFYEYFGLKYLFAYIGVKSHELFLLWTEENNLFDKEEMKYYNNPYETNKKVSLSVTNKNPPYREYENKCEFSMFKRNGSFFDE